MSYLRPKPSLSPEEVQKGLRMVIWDGLASEMMTSFTGGTFLVAFSLLLGASNLQIGLLSSLPLFTNLAQLLSVWLVKRYNNRRAVAVYSAYLARVPLLLIAASVLWVGGATMDMLLFFLFFHYLFGSIAGPSWNSWMKDMVPEQMLGAYFSRRSRYTQMLNIVLSLLLALLLDKIKQNHPDQELNVYALFFLVGGMVGIIGGYLLSKAPEPQSYLQDSNIISLFKIPLRNINFRRLLIFNAAWVFAINIASPFFTVFMMKTMGLPIVYIIALGVVSQLFSVLTLNIWGIFSDRYSNKSIIFISAPIYIICILAWCFVGINAHFLVNIALLTVIHIFTGISTAGINLSLTNIGLKLSSKKEAIVYLSVKNIIAAMFSAMGPLVGGLLADFFAHRRLSVTVEWSSPTSSESMKLVSLHEWGFLFVIAAMLALFALEFLLPVKETGEVSKKVVRRIMRTSIKTNLKEYFIIGNIISLHEQIIAILSNPWRRGRRKA